MNCDTVVAGPDCTNWRTEITAVPRVLPIRKFSEYYSYTVKPVLNGISRDHNIFPLKPGFRLIKVHYIQYKKLNQDMQTLTLR